LNFKSILLYLSFSLLVSCGVKSDPVPPAGTGIPSYIEEVSKLYQPAPIETKKNKKVKKK
jgi:hypothetical protein